MQLEEFRSWQWLNDQKLKEQAWLQKLEEDRKKKEFELEMKTWIEKEKEDQWVRIEYENK